MSSSFPHIITSPQTQRPKQRTPPTTLQNQTLFRILCNATTIGALIGPSGAFLSHLRLDTGGTRIHCCDTIPGSNERVVIIVGDKSVSRTVELVNSENEDESVVFEVSCAQEALLRVVGRVVEVERSGICCRVVVDGRRVWDLLGRGRRNLERIERETGATIHVRNPTGFGYDGWFIHDQIFVISGDIIAMNRALHAVSSCLQVDHGLLMNGPVGTPCVPLPNRHLNYFPHLNTNIPHPAGLVDCAVSGHTVPLNTNTVASHSKKQQVEFRLLCQAFVAGGIIGWKGSVIKALQIESGASIAVASPVDDCQERVITVTALEDFVSFDSAAQRAILCVFTKLLELCCSRENVQARLLVNQPFIGFLSGDNGQTVSLMQQATGASILVMGGDHVPKCAAKNDVVVHISGNYINVHNAIFLVTTKLRDGQLLSGAHNGVSLRFHSSSAYPHISTYGTANGKESSEPLQISGQFPDLSQEVTISESIEQLRISLLKDSSSLPKNSDDTEIHVITENGTDFTTSGGDNQLARSAIVKKTTMEIAIPQTLFASIFGEGGNNLGHMKQISGADLEVYEAEDGEGKVVVSGTPNQTMAAQNLLQAFILARQ